MSESFAALFEESLQRTEMRPGEVITAEVVRVEHNFVVVNAGLKSEAYVPLEEFKNDKGEVEVQVGDFVSVAIGSIENGYGDTILSRDKAKRLASWLSLETSLESGEFVTGTVNGKHLEEQVRLGFEQVGEAPQSVRIGLSRQRKLPGVSGGEHLHTWQLDAAHRAPTHALHGLL
eukprot:gene65098-89070_t